MNQRAINPDSNTYITLKGEANEVLKQYIIKLGLSEIFEVSAKNSGIYIDYKVPLQSMLLDAFLAALEKVGARIEIIDQESRMKKDMYCWKQKR